MRDELSKVALTAQIQLVKPTESYPVLLTASALFVVKYGMSFFQRFNAVQRSLISAVFGFFFYGGWAYLVNSPHGHWVAVKAACVQGSYSFTLTLCMTLLLEGMFRVMSQYFESRSFINWTTIVTSCALVFSGSWLVNLMAGTPEILRTVILGYVIGGAYSTSYVYSLAKVRQG